MAELAQGLKRNDWKPLLANAIQDPSAAKELKERLHESGYYAVPELLEIAKEVQALAKVGAVSQEVVCELTDALRRPARAGHPGWLTEPNEMNHVSWENSSKAAQIWLDLNLWLAGELRPQVNSVLSQPSSPDVNAQRNSLLTAFEVVLAPPEVSLNPDPIRFLADRFPDSVAKLQAARVELEFDVKCLKESRRDYSGKLSARDRVALFNTPPKDAAEVDVRMDLARQECSEGHLKVAQLVAAGATGGVKSCLEGLRNLKEVFETEPMFTHPTDAAIPSVKEKLQDNCLRLLPAGVSLERAQELENEYEAIARPTRIEYGKEALEQLRTDSDKPNSGALYQARDLLKPGTFALFSSEQLTEVAELRDRAFVVRHGWWIKEIAVCDSDLSNSIGQKVQELFVAELAAGTLNAPINPADPRNQGPRARIYNSHRGYLTMEQGKLLDAAVLE